MSSGLQVHNAEESSPYDPLADPEERRVLDAALDSFRQYRQTAHYNITHVRRQSFYSLPPAQIELLSSPPFSLPRTFEAVDEAIDSNAEIAEAILQAALPGFGYDQEDTSWKGKAKPSDLDKARSTIRQLYRDWSAEGLPERHASHRPIFSALATHIDAENAAQMSQKQILVPGAGLGRLVLEICAMGYSVEGNEISYHQLLASNYILNFVRQPGQFKMYPWALNFSNHLTRSNQLQSVYLPDVLPSTLLEQAYQGNPGGRHYSERMSMSAGDFVVLYRQPEYAHSFDAVVTCFFIDTAPNVINYIETIKHCLVLGGVWINVGPLLWHFESAPTPAELEKRNEKQPGRSLRTSEHDGIGEPGSFELTDEEVVALLVEFGFEVIEHQPAPATGYIQDPAAMLQNVYRPSFWVARKAMASGV